MEKLKITRGKCTIINVSTQNNLVYRRINVEGKKSIGFICVGGTYYQGGDKGVSRKEADANAELIKEAFNVANETERTPRQLANEQKEANLFIIEIAKMLNMDTDGIGFDDLKFSLGDFKNAINNEKAKNYPAAS